MRALPFFSQLRRMKGKPSPALVSFLRKVPVFGGLEGRSLEHMIALLEERSFDSGEHIFNEGEHGRTMYVLREGEVEVLRSSSEGQQVPIVRLGPGETFGEMALVDLEPRSATVKVLRPALTYALTILDLYHLYQVDTYAYVIFLQNVCRMVSRRLRKADRRIAEFLSALSSAADRSVKQKAAAGPAMVAKAAAPKAASRKSARRRR